MNAAVSHLEASHAGSRARPLATWLSSMAVSIGVCIDTMADYYAAATIYEQLSRLSDAELRRRGLSRANLGREVVAARERSAGMSVPSMIT